MASPPFNIAELSPTATDLVSQYPGVEQTFRDVVESWLTILSNPATGLIKPTAFPIPFELESTDAGAATGPTISLYRNSPSPAVADVMGQLEFNGEDSAGNKTIYGYMNTRIADPTNGSEDGTVSIGNVVAGVETDRITLGAIGVAITGTLFGSIANFSGTVTSGQIFQSSSLFPILSPSGASGQIFFRPNGPASGVGECVINSSGNLISSGGVYSSNQIFSCTVGSVILAAGGSSVVLRPNGAASGTGQAYVDASGNFVASANIVAYSDRRYKENIQMLDAPGEVIDTIIPVSFTYTESGQDGIGFIAQDFQEFYPELVLESETGTLSLAYGNITALLWREAQDLRARVALLEAK